MWSLWILAVRRFEDWVNGDSDCRVEIGCEAEYFWGEVGSMSEFWFDETIEAHVELSYVALIPDRAEVLRHRFKQV